MRHMPSHVTDATTGVPRDIPALPRREFARQLSMICQHIHGRDVTGDEAERANKMADHNWTVRVIASELWGEAPVDQYYLPRD